MELGSLNVRSTVVLRTLAAAISVVRLLATRMLMMVLPEFLGGGGDSSLDGGFDLAWAQPAGREGQAGLSAVTIETRLTLLHAASRMRV